MLLVLTIEQPARTAKPLWLPDIVLPPFMAMVDASRIAAEIKPATWACLSLKFFLPRTAMGALSQRSVLLF